MSERLVDKRWPWIAASFAIIVYFLSSFIDLRVGLGGDPRPLGGAEDIEALRKRNDWNVLFVVIDTLRADRLGSYGYARDTTPEMDREASMGVRFARHLAQSSWTKASMASLWTGLYPSHLGVTRNPDIVPPQARMPAEILREAGFATAGAFRNGWVAPNFGFDQGFEIYINPRPRPLSGLVHVLNPTLAARSSDHSLTEAAREFMLLNGGLTRWFLYLHLMDLHEYTFTEDTALFGGTYSDIYDNSLRWVDTVMGDLLDYLGSEGYAENTLVVITSDHGEAFRERGFEGHARWLYRESTEIPLILGFPFRLEPGVVIETRSRGIDVWPTLFDLLGLAGPEESDGRSLVPEILAAVRGEERLGDQPLAYAHLDRNWGRRGEDRSPSVAIVDGSLRYVRSQDAKGGVVEALFDSEGDPLEKNNVLQAMPVEAERLRALADQHLGEPPIWGKVPTREIGEMELQQLRALGYEIP